jgi:hypothetical protein
MFLGKNRSLNQSGAFGEAANPEVGGNTEFLNQANRPMPNGMQRFLAKKGINSSNDLFNRVQNSPSMPFRKAR